MVVDPRHRGARRSGGEGRLGGWRGPAQVPALLGAAVLGSAGDGWRANLAAGRRRPPVRAGCRGAGASLNALVTRGLTKRYGGVAAVDGLDLAVEEGTLFGFLGPNGAGKTTTIRVLLGLVFPTDGQVEVLGR